MKIAIASDHHGVDLKQKLTKYLEDKDYNVVDCGPNTNEMVDYPEYAFKVGNMISNQDADYGILICNTGIGMSIAANKVKGVRCARVVSEEDAKMTRRDNDANVIALSAQIEILNIFFNTEFLKLDRYVRRIEEINNYEH